MAANPSWAWFSDTSDTLNWGDEREAKTMRSKEEQEQIVKRALSEGRIIATPACFNCDATMTPTTDIQGKPCFECRSCDAGDGTDRPDGVVGDGASVIDQIIENGDIV